MSKKTLFLLALLALLLSPVIVSAQTASTGLVAGTVLDKSSASVPGATVELREIGTNAIYTQTTGTDGQYQFSTVKTGLYKMTVRKDGFKEWTTEFKISASKSYSPPIVLEIGAKAEVVVVEATAGAEIQKTDATVGTTIGGDELKYMPIANRSVASLLTLQPLVMPIGVGIGTDNGGQVAGARSDQNVMLIDGGDATSDTEASGGYNTGFTGEQRPMIPVPVESIEEFRVGTTNPNATFGRSQGGQVVMVTKHGTNSLHGSAYWYHQNDNLNANSWDNNTAGIKKPELKDNRYGFTAGGPIFKDRLFFFGHFEARDFPQSATFNRIVPTATFRRGIITMGGVPYNLNLANGPLSVACQSPSVGGACDPRGLGASSVTLADLNSLPLPTPGSGVNGCIPGFGDQVNVCAYRNVIRTGLTEKFGLARFDYKVNALWNVFVSGRYQSFHQPGAQQIDITGLSGCAAPCAVRVNPLQPRYFVAGVDGQITPHLLSETRVSWFRHWWEWGTHIPGPQVAGTAAALSLAGEGTGAGGSVKIADPFNIDTQNARSRIWNGKDFFVSQNFTVLRGKHTFNMGGSYRFQNIFHQRTDKVTGGLSTAPIFYLNAGSFFTVVNQATGDTFRPAGLGSTDRTRWNNWYAALMGIPDKTAQVLTRDGSLNPQPLGTTLQAQVHIHALEGFLQDTYRMTPQLTLTLGVNYQVQRPPTEAKGRQMVPVYASNGEPIDMDNYYGNMESAALQGNILNPDIAYSTVNNIAGHKYVVNHIDWNNVGPRLAFAWNPSQSLFGMGNGKMVLRGGYAVTYTRMNGVGLVMTPILAPGLGNILSCKGPQIGGICAGSSNPTNAFRIGPDGTGATILPSAQPIPVAANPFPVAAPYGETRGFAIDPGLKLGYAHSFDLTVQRELPWNLLIEVGYVGRLGRNLIQNVDFNAVPFMFKEKISGQILAAAFTNVELAIQNGTAVATQPWFENMGLQAACFAGLINNSNMGCPTGPAPAATNYSTVTAYLSTQFNQEFAAGDLATPFLSGSGGLDILRFRCGTNTAPSTVCPPGNGMKPIDNIQVQINNLTSHRGTSSYHAGFISLHKRMSHGLTFDINYTLGHSLDLFGINQENTQFSYTSPYRPNLDREPSAFDRRHVLNAHWYYVLPFGKGQRWVNNNVLDKVVGGWHFAGIWTMSSGQPLCPYNGAGSINYGAPDAFACLLPAASFKNPGASVINTGGNLNTFGNPTAVSNMFRYPLMTTDGRFGFGSLRGLGRWNVDLSLGKMTTITERVKLGFTVDLLNAFNHPIFNDPNIDVTDPSSFGVLSSQNNRPRFIQFGFRVEF